MKTDDLELPTEFDHVPTPKELSRWIGFMPGVHYCWALAKNLSTAKKNGWAMIQLANADGLLGQVPPLQIAGQLVMLLAQGRPIIGMAPTHAGVELFMDPELADLLKVKTPPAPPVKLATQPQPQKQAVAR